MATRPWDPVSDLGASANGGAVVALFDVLATSTLTFTADQTGVTKITSTTGPLALSQGSSGIPAYRTLNGNKALYGATNYSYFKTTTLTGIPVGSASLTFLLVGAGTSSYNATLALASSGSVQQRTVGTVSPNKIGAPTSGNDLDSSVSYGSNGNVVVCQWDASNASSQVQTLFADGTQLATRSRTDLAGATPGTLQLLTNTASTTSVDFFQCAAVFNRVLTTAERQQLEGWAAWRYNLVAQLPANHPYKAAAPTVDTGGGIVVRRRQCFVVAS